MDVRRFRFLCSLAVAALLATACGGGGGGTGGGGVPPTPTPTPTVTPTSTPQPTLLCTTAGAAQSYGTPRAAQSVAIGRHVLHRAASGYAPGLIEVVRSSSAQVRYAANAARMVRSDEIPHAAQTIDLIRVTPGSESSAMRNLSAAAGVRSVSRVTYRSTLSTTAAFTNDPYFQGFPGANVPPLYEGSNIPGQWDMHVICAANAWGYANANTTGRTYPAAAGGSPSVKVAVVDTGAYLQHPELTGRVAYAESDLNGVTSTSGVDDTDGHGTNVTGIIGAAANNSLGFTGVAYNASLMIFKVFGDGCGQNCTALSSDIALAINHAVAHGANVINLSLGGSTPDSAEESAVAAAIAAGVVVVAASGNESSSSLDYPAADGGVIAVGASGIDDTNPLSIGENVATYSNYDASHPTTWGLVAPGGTAPNSNDSDDLHWIENLYTNVDPNNPCSPDYGGGNATIDCRALFDGTSQATPHVAGAAALLLSVGASPANIKNILCSTANGIASSAAGCGRLNIYRAMAQVVGDASP